MAIRLYVMFIEKARTRSRLTRAAVERHAANLKKPDASGHLELGGARKGCPGVAGMCVRAGAARRRRSSARPGLWSWRDSPPAG